jgi:hypothetical protein
LTYKNGIPIVLPKKREFLSKQERNSCSSPHKKEVLIKILGNTIFIPFAIYVKHEEVNVKREISSAMNLPILPGESIFLRFDESDVRESRLSQILPNDLIAIEQSCPPVEKTSLHRIILFTYKVSQKKERCGFEARIEEITTANLVILHKIIQVR